MTTDRSRVTDALIARALTERAAGPNVDLVAPVMASVSATPQRRGWAVRLGPGHRTMVLGFAAVALAVSLVVAAAAGSMILRPRFVERPLPGNGPITIQVGGGLTEVDPQSGRTLADVALSPVTIGSVADLAWSPDGSRLAVSTDRGLSILDIATGQTSSPMTCVLCPVAWSPDGTELAVVNAAQAIVLIDPGMGTGSRRSSRRNESLGPGSPGHQTADVSHTSSSMPVHRTPSMAIIERDGSNKRTLALPTRGDLIIDASWSPDGATIAYIGNAVPFGDAAVPLDLVLLDPEGVRPARVDPGRRVFLPWLFSGPHVVSGRTTPGVQLADGTRELRDSLRGERRWDGSGRDRERGQRDDRLAPDPGFAPGLTGLEVSRGAAPATRMAGCRSPTPTTS